MWQRFLKWWRACDLLREDGAPCRAAGMLPIGTPLRVAAVTQDDNGLTQYVLEDDEGRRIALHEVQA
jgi:hypothetical protein